MSYEYITYFKQVHLSVRTFTCKSECISESTCINTQVGS